MSIQVLHGDCREILPTLAENSIDACCTDPPYGINFMSKRWDDQIAFDRDTWAEVFRVLKPGGYLLSFGGTRTYHRMVCAIEDAGFLIYPLIAWVFATGFPKATKFQCPGMEGWRYGMQSLKPAIEPICMAQRPMIGTGTENWLRHGTGGINVDACRVATGESLARPYGGGNEIYGTFAMERGTVTGADSLGRWPANLVHDSSPEVEAAFAAFGEKTSGWSNTDTAPSTGHIYGNDYRNKTGAHFADTGTASRFFYSAKATASDRADSRHPTVKPIDLIRWLVRMVTPPNGTVLDPFAGSGTTGEAAMLEGFNAILIEREVEHTADIEHRVKRWRGADLPLFAP